jgi:hypothetical protein
MGRIRYAQRQNILDSGEHIKAAVMALAEAHNGS